MKHTKVLVIVLGICLLIGAGTMIVRIINHQQTQAEFDIREAIPNEIDEDNMGAGIDETDINAADTNKPKHDESEPYQSSMDDESVVQKNNNSKQEKMEPIEDQEALPIFDENNVKDNASNSAEQKNLFDSSNGGETKTKNDDVSGDKVNRYDEKESKIPADTSVDKEDNSLDKHEMPLVFVN